MSIDTHSHIMDDAFNEDREEVIQRIVDNNMEKCMIICSRLEEVIPAIELKRRDPRFQVAVGIHPEDVTRANELWDTFMEYSGFEEIDAIGEIGLDYYWDKDHKEEQKELFINQIKRAMELNKPILVHARDAIQDTYDIMKEYRCTGVMHCFAGSVEMAKEFTKLGYYLAFGGALTFKNAKHSVDVVKAIDMNYLLTETDCPYMTPVPYRGKRNEPFYVSLVAEKMAEIKEMTVEEVDTIILKNYDRLLNNLPAERK